MKVDRNSCLVAGSSAVLVRDYPALRHLSREAARHLGFGPCRKIC